MKTLFALLAAGAALGGCAAYVDPYPAYGGYPAHSGGVYQAGPGYYGSYPVYPAQQGVYQAGPGYYGSYPVYPAQQGVYRDRDRDGIPNRVDADRDNDGVPNTHDRRPNNPRRW